MHRLGRDLGIAAAVLLVVSRAAGLVWPVGHDAHAYWVVNIGHPYVGAVPGATDAFNYSPAFAQLISPLGALPFPIFLGIWTALLCAALLWLAGPLAIVIVLCQPVWLELVVGNVNLLIAVAVVIGFRYPAAWAFVLLTKVTPGIGVLWFAFRREWRNLALALGATLAIVAVSFIAAPALWAQWVNALLADSGRTGVQGAYLDLPLLVRLPVAAAVIAVGARWNKRWVLPIAVVLAMPYVWESTLCVLVAIVPLAREDAARLGSHLSRLVRRAATGFTPRPTISANS